MSKSRILSWILLITTFGLILFLRFYKLGSIPQGLNIDEASYGYDAYSLLKTGRDQWGIKYPLSLKSFGDYKPAGLAYSIIPAIKLLGLNTLSVRLPAAIAGFGLTILLYCLLNYMFPQKKLNLFLTLVFSLSPWAYGISRLFYEPGIALLIYLLGWYLLYRSLNEFKLKYLVVAGVLLGLAGYWYTAFRVIGVATLLFASVLFFLKYRNKILKGIFYSFVAFILISLPLIPGMLKGGDSTRLKQEEIKLREGYQLTADDGRAMCYLASGKNMLVSKLCYIIWNKPVIRVERTFLTLLNNVSPDYLFQNSYQADIIPESYGSYVSFLSIFYFLGLLSLIAALNTKSNHKYFSLFILGSFIFSQLPVLLIQAPLVHRNLASIFFAFLIIAHGWYFLLSKIKSFWVYPIAAIILFQTVIYLTNYYAVFTKRIPEVWRYDQKEVMDYVQQHYNEYDEILIDGFEDAPLYYAFDSSMDPELFHSSAIMGHINSTGWMHYSSVGKVKAAGSMIDYLCQNKVAGRKILYVTPPMSLFSHEALVQTREFTGVHHMHEIYDLSKLTIKPNCPKTN